MQIGGTTRYYLLDVPANADNQTPLALAVGTAVCAGGALFPDLDLSGKVTRNQGGASLQKPKLANDFSTSQMRSRSSAE